MTNTTTPADVAGWVAQAKADKTWLIIVYHQIDPDTSAEPFGCTPADFESMMQAIQTSGVPAVTEKQALDEVLPYVQKYSVTGTVTGGDGTVTPAQQSVDYGSNASLTLNPAPGFAISSIKDNGVPQPVANPFVIRNVTADNSVEVKFAQSTWYLAEGSTNWGFSDYITIENPNSKALSADITYMLSGGTDVKQAVGLPAMSQTTVNPADVLGQQDFSTIVRSSDGTSAISVDRTMTWIGPGAPSPEAHSSIGVTTPARTWFLPEGSTRWGFECWTLVQNPGLTEASVALNYMTEGAGLQVVYHTVPPHARATFSMADDIGPEDSSIMVSSNQPVIAERSMYRNNRREGHSSIGSTTASTDYYLAEGTTAHGFTSYLLVQNPKSSPVDVTLTYMTPSGPVTQPTFTMPPDSRRTINVNEVAEVSSTDLSTHVHGSSPIVAERAMYWGAGTALGEAGHDSIGIDKPTHDLVPPRRGDLERTRDLDDGAEPEQYQRDGAGFVPARRRRPDANAYGHPVRQHAVDLRHERPGPERAGLHPRDLSNAGQEDHRRALHVLELPRGRYRHHRWLYRLRFSDTLSLTLRAFRVAVLSHLEQEDEDVSWAGRFLLNGTHRVSARLNPSSGYRWSLTGRSAAHAAFGSSG
jgi:hypothetical protein